MAIASQSRPVSSGIIAGSIGGIAGGIAMIPFFIVSALLSNMAPMMIFRGIGFTFGADADSSIVLGVAMHLTASVLIGIIFGIVTGAIGKLRITSYRSGIGLGLIAGAVAYIVLYIPMTMPSTMSQAGTLPQLTMSMMIGIAEHLVYGAVLGVVTATLILNAEKRRTGGFFECSTCHSRFASAQDLDEHIRVAHSSFAA